MSKRGLLHSGIKLMTFVSLDTKLVPGNLIRASLKVCSFVVVDLLLMDLRGIPSSYTDT